MKKIFIYLMLLFSVLVTSSHAEKWTKFDETKSVVVYYDKQSFLKYGDFRDINLLYDLKEPFNSEKGIVKSMTLFKEISCKDKKVNVKKQDFFAQKMGEGQPFFSISDSGWKTVNADDLSIDGAIFKAACEIE